MKRITDVSHESGNLGRMLEIKNQYCEVCKQEVEGAKLNQINALGFVEGPKPRSNCSHLERHGLTPSHVKSSGG